MSNNNDNLECDDGEEKMLFELSVHTDAVPSWPGHNTRARPVTGVLYVGPKLTS